MRMPLWTAYGGVRIDRERFFLAAAGALGRVLTGLLSNLQEKVLPNGLKVITKEVPSSPAISHWVWYRAGSRNELPGITGVSHWVEHMLFKGTKNFTKDQIDRLLSKHGGMYNAFTSQDHTTYFETLPAKQLDLALRVEADRMQNATFPPKEVEAERTVIISEREGMENEPTYLLYEEVLSSAFKAHPYGWPVVGWTCDLKAMTRDDLYNYYQTAYSPDNAFIVLAGRFHAKEALARMDELYGTIPRRKHPERPVTSEPAQSGERRVLVRKPGNTEYLMIAYHTPHISHDDAFPLMILDAIMSGAKAVRSGPGFERSGRLYRALVEKQLASAAYSNFQESVDPNIFSFFVTARSGVPAEKVEKVLIHEVERIRRRAPSAKESKRALAQTEAQLAYATDGVTGQAYLIGAAELHLGYQHLGKIMDKLKTVTPADVRRVAEAYLGEDNRTVGIFKPSKEAPQ